MEALPLDMSHPAVREYLSLVRLQVLTPLSLLINIATIAVCAAVVNPSIGTPSSCLVNGETYILIESRGGLQTSSYIHFPEPCCNRCVFGSYLHWTNRILPPPCHRKQGRD